MGKNHIWDQETKTPWLKEGDKKKGGKAHGKKNKGGKIRNRAHERGERKMSFLKRGELMSDQRRENLQTSRKRGDRSTEESEGYQKLEEKKKDSQVKGHPVSKGKCRFPGGRKKKNEHKGGGQIGCKA